MSGAAADEPRRFPVLDPEDPPPSWRRRLLIAGGGAVVVAAATGLILVLVGGSGGGAGRPASGRSTASVAGGRVLFVSPTGVLGLASPGGTIQQNLASLGMHLSGGYATGVASADDRVIVTGDGDVFSVDHAQLAAGPAGLDLGPNRILADNGAFADGDRRVVVFEGTGPTAGVALVDWRTGATTQLGVVDREEDAGGDPAGAGAYVAVGQGSASTTGWADSAIELRTAGARPKVVATAAAMNTALGQAGPTPVVLSADPDPAGDRIAITVNTAETAPGEYTVGPSIGLVVVDRAGPVLATLAGPMAPPTAARVAWSPNGRSIAFVTGGPDAAPAVVVWTPGVGYLARPLPRATEIPSSVTWSSDSQSILVTTQGAKGNIDGWITGSARAGKLSQSADAPGPPIAWLTP